METNGECDRLIEMAQYKLYIKSWCPWCVAARDWLDRAGIPYAVYELGETPGATEEMVRISKQRYVPTLVIEPDDSGVALVLPDFGPDELEAFLKRHKLYPPNV